MNEAGFTRAVNDLVKRISPEVRVWKISDRFTRGVPDCRYSGPTGSLFVEYKWSKTLARNAKPALRTNQQLWLEAEHNYGTHVAVVLGTPEKCLIFDQLAWKNPSSAEHAVSRREVAEWIAQICSK
jgi:hypothetical protein